MDKQAKVWPVLSKEEFRIGEEIHRLQDKRMIEAAEQFLTVVEANAGPDVFNIRRFYNQVNRIDRLALTAHRAIERLKLALDEDSMSDQ